MRGTTLILPCALLGIGCHGVNRPPPRAAEVNPRAYPQEVSSPTGMSGTLPSSQPKPATSSPGEGVATSPPPAAGTSTPTPSTLAPERQPFKPGGPQPPSGTGGGPKDDTGGSVIGDESEGNTGAVKPGGDRK
ncbi:MAG: hypothetical protein HYV09_23740 [Deltaproteobacteria bacterium]|nr:hypothetical protein [Deltaproteobacteria bacterium]